MKTIEVLVAKGPFLTTSRQLVEDHEPTPRQRHRWQFAPYWLVEGPKGPHWCQAPGREGARTVYRGIPWDGKMKHSPYVGGVARKDLAEGAVFWVKAPRESSKPRRIVKNTDVPAPDGYDQIEPPRHNE